MFRAPGKLNDVRALISEIENGRSGYIAATKECVSVLEAFWNELIEVGVGYKNHGHGSTNRLVTLAGVLKKLEEERKPIEEKAIAAFEALSGQKLFKSQASWYQKIRLLVDVRNELAHPKAASIELTDDGVILSKKHKRLINQLRAHGFFNQNDKPYDWEEVVGTREFSVWAYQTVIDVVAMVFGYWPYPEAADSYRELYSVPLREPENWPNKKMQPTQ